MNKIAIVGYGYLGKAFARFFSDFEVVVYDPAYKEYSDFDKVNTADLAVICVPTNMKEGGSADTSIVWDVASKITIPTVIKSAVPPGTTDALNIKYGDLFVVSPEYMGESTYYTPPKYPHPQDGKSHGFLVVGGPEPVATLVVDTFMRVMGPDTKVIKMDAIEAELVKYMENTWGATKVTFANEFYEICKAFKADYHKVREGWAMDGRVERMHTMVLPDKRGFGGKCFPKDLFAIIHASTKKNYHPKLLLQVLHSNEEFIAKNNE